MLEYARWKYIVVGVVLLLALILALPNVFGEAPALQFVRMDRAEITAQAQAEIEKFLTDQKIPYVGTLNEKERFTVRFANVPDQLRARDAVTANDKLSKTYARALSFITRAPPIFGKLGLKPMPLGLDLRGGLNLLYQVDTAGAVAQVLDSYEQSLRRALQDAKIPFTDVVQVALDNSKANNAVRVLLPPGTDAGTVRDALAKTVTDLTLDTLNLATGPAVQGVLSEKQIRERTDYAITKNIETIRNRVNEMGVAEPIVQRQGTDRINVQLAGVQNSAEVKDILGKVATLEWRMVDMSNNAYEAKSRGRAPLGSKLYTERRNGAPVLLKREVIVTGDNLTDARSTTTQEGPGVAIKLDSAGGDRMFKNTSANVGRLMGVVFIEKSREPIIVDGKPLLNADGKPASREITKQDVISVATIQGVFGPQFNITGLATSEARDLALLLRAGSLAAPIYVVEERVVGPSVGAENIQHGITALLIGMAGTFAFMIIYYKVFGIVADLVLLANVVLLSALLSALGTQLSLPGIAGIILTVGMAVDANVLIYERIREELRLGVSPQAAIKAGFEKAFSAIMDSNVTTLIAGLVLYVLGRGPIQNFAVVLVLGIATSMFTALMGSRALLTLMYGGKRKLTRLPI
jgi:preprotein translocase subunit SecD